jgi:excisionase family DNA binding protein
MSQIDDNPLSDPDQLYTYREAARRLGIPYFKIQRAARSGLIPTYSILNGRKYVRLCDILKRMSATP